MAPPQASEAMTLFAAVEAKPDIEAAKKCAAVAKAVEGAALAEAGFFEALEASSQAGKKKENKREAAAMVFGALCAEQHHHDAYMLKMAPLMVELVGDKTRPVMRAAQTAADSFVRRVAKDKAEANGAMQNIIEPALESTKFQVKCFALEAISKFAELCPDSVCTSMPELVPAVCGELHDTKKEVVAAAEQALKDIASVIENKDINALVPVMIDALMNPTKVPDCVFSLSCTKFVATVQRPELALVTPLLLRGFQTRETKIVRQCAKISENLSKLVEVASEAEPLLPKLTPELEGAAEHTSDPECREVCGKVVAHLNKLSGIIEKEKLHRLDAGKFLKMLGEDKQVSCADPVVLGHVSQLLEALFTMKELDADCWTVCCEAVSSQAKSVAAKIFEVCEPVMKGVEKEEDEDAAELCNCQFTLAYGTKILLKNTTLRLLRGYKYGLLGANECGKTSLLKAIAMDQVEGFPPSTEVRTVFVEADVLGELSHLTCIEYIFADQRIKDAGITRDAVEAAMSSVGFAGAKEIAGGKAARIMDPVTSLSGGWRMKLALARAMLQKADILLMDDPTNHLDVMNVAWVENYIMGLKDVTCVIVSQNAALLNKCCSRIVHFDSLRLHNFKGSLDAFVAEFPEAKSYFELKSSRGLKFSFPDPSFIEGVNSRGKVLMKMDNVDFGYPSNPNLTVTNLTVRVSMASRVACLGPNGAGKSTMIKLLTGELEPKTGTVWKHPNCKIAYVAQHAFHHIEKHLKMTPCEYILWRYEFGADKESLNKVTMVLTEAEEKKMLEERTWEYTNDEGLNRMKAAIDKLTGTRKSGKRGGYKYEVMFKTKSGNADGPKGFIDEDDLNKHGWEKHVKLTAEKIAAEEGRYKRPLTASNVEKLYADVGLDREYASHHQMNSLSAGQKVKVVMAAAMWDQPHVVILDEPTNYLDRESLAALAGAIEEYKGGVVIITHNDQFSKHLCPETWVLEKGDDGIGRLDCRGDADWMEAALKEKTAGVQMDEMVDALGNVTKVKNKKKELSRKEKKQRDLAKKRAKEAGLPWSSDEDDE